jgi:hypothetical protein
MFSLTYHHHIEQLYFLIIPVVPDQTGHASKKVGVPNDNCVKNADTLTSSATRSGRNYKYPIFVILSTKPFTMVIFNDSSLCNTQKIF